MIETGKKMADKLQRTLTLKDAISIVAGSMIGCGIFIVSADISRQVNSAWVLLLVWLVAGFITICGCLSYGEIASMIPAEGGQYIYLKKMFNEKIAFVYGWTLFLVIQTGTLAAINIALAKFIGLVVPAISSSKYLFTIGAFHFSTQQLFAICMVILLTFINSRGVKLGILVQNLFTATKIISMVAIICCGLFLGLNWEVISQNFAPANNDIILGLPLVKTVAVAIVGALFASITWNNVTFISAEIKKPRKNIPLALTYGSLMVILLYILINFVYVGVIPLELIKTAPEDVVAAQLISQIFGAGGMLAIAIIVSISAFGCANGMIMAGSRVYYKMAKDKIFFRGLAFINRKTRVPENSLWLQCFWICVLILWGSYSQLLDYVIYASLIFYALTVFGLFKLRKEAPSRFKIFRVNNIAPIGFLLTSILIVVALTVYKPLYTVPGLFITVLGFPIYSIWKRKKKHKKHLVKKLD